MDFLKNVIIRNSFFYVILNTYVNGFVLFCFLSSAGLPAVFLQREQNLKYL